MNVPVPVKPSTLFNILMMKEAFISKYTLWGKDMNVRVKCKHLLSRIYQLSAGYTMILSAECLPKSMHCFPPSIKLPAVI